METKAIHAMVMSILPFAIQSCAPLEVPVIAHRGASFLAAENTLSAVKLAWELGVDAVEIDVRMTQDEKIVLMHDPSTKRTTGQNFVISETTSRELERLQVGKPWAKATRTEKIPYLDEVLETIPEGGRLFIEVKTGPEIVSPICKLLESYQHRERLVIIGFDFETISQIKANLDWLQVYWLLGPESRRPLKQNPEEFVKKAKSSALNGLNVHAGLANQKLQTLTQSAGLKFLVWVVNHTKTALNLSHRQVDGITTDRPELFLRQD